MKKTGKRVTFTISYLHNKMRGTRRSTTLRRRGIPSTTQAFLKGLEVACRFTTLDYTLLSRLTLQSPTTYTGSVTQHTTQTLIKDRTLYHGNFGKSIAPPPPRTVGLWWAHFDTGGARRRLATLGCSTVPSLYSSQDIHLYVFNAWIMRIYWFAISKYSIKMQYKYSMRIRESKWYLRGSWNSIT